MEHAKTLIQLYTPFKRGEEVIKSITLRKPNAGELRGVSLLNLAQMDVESLTKVLPRITTPTLTEREVSLLDPADLISMGKEITSFLLPNADQDFPTT